MTDGARPGDVVRLLWERTQAVSFADVTDGLIARSVDYWLDDAGDPAPDWRAPYRLAPRPAEESE